MTHPTTTAPAKAEAEEARAQQAQRSYEFWLACAKAIAPKPIRLREIREQINEVDARQRAALAALKAEEAAIEAKIAELKERLSDNIREQFDAARPFEAELDKLYEEENRCG